MEVAPLHVYDLGSGLDFGQGHLPSLPEPPLLLFHALAIVADAAGAA